MALFKRTVKNDNQRKERLVSIRRSIESSVRFEEDALSRPLNPSTLKRVYNIDSLWIVSGAETQKMGSANYSRELSIFSEIRQRYGEMSSIVINRGGVRYHVLEKGSKVYAFSTPLELSSADLMMILNELEARLCEKNVFLSCSVNITENDS